MKYRRLAREERYQIQALLASGVSLRFVAQQLQRHASTISRELRKSPTPYRAAGAQQITDKRKYESHQTTRKIKGSLKRYVDRRIEVDWSPDQIAGRLRFLNRRELISYQTVYRYLDQDKRGGGLKWKHLRILRRGNYYRKIPKNERTRSIPDRTMIDDRPRIVEYRNRLGDYERDTILGKFNGAVLLSIVDRSALVVRLARLKKKTADLAHRHTVSLLKDLPVHTITNDNGSEFAHHRYTSAELNAKVYFAHPHKSWQRGTNENINGLIRQYFPRRTDMRKYRTQRIKYVEDLLNNRPRKSLGYRTPNEVLKSGRQPLR